MAARVRKAYASYEPIPIFCFSQLMSLAVGLGAVVAVSMAMRVGLAVATNDAHSLVCKHAHWQAPHGGGQGAARDLCELIMEAQGTLDSEMQKYLN